MPLIPIEQIGKEVIVTAGARPHSIASVHAWTGAIRTDTSSLPGRGLTKRRAVDFCLVAAALCQVCC